MSKLYAFLKVIAYPFFKLFFRLKFKKPTAEFDGKGCLICSNHLSAIDPAFVGLGLKRQVKFLAKAEVTRLPIIHALAKRFAITINRGKGDFAAIRASIAAVEEKNALVVFPQGTRRKGLIPAQTEVKSGIAMIAARAKCGIIPAYIYTKNYRVHLFRKVTVIYGEPITFEELGIEKGDMKEYDRAAAFVWQKICDLAPDKEVNENGNNPR